MNKKSVLVDLAKLKMLNCGLGQTALNYGVELGKFKSNNVKINLLIPSVFNGYFGENVNHLNINPIYRYLPKLNKSFDLWHSTSQLSRFSPSSDKVPLLLTIHDLNFMYEKNEEKAARCLDRLQKQVDRACLITTISEYTASDVRKYLDVKKKDIRVVHNGVRLNKFENTEKPIFINDKTPFFFTIGQVVEKKNFHALLDFMSYFPQKYLFICGEDNSGYAEQLKKEILKKKLCNVFIPGVITDEEKNWLYMNCEAFVFPSKFEGFGLPIIEAMQCGKPVFSSSMTSLKEIGDKYAYFWNNFEADHMADVVKAGLIHFDSHSEIPFLEIEYANSYSYRENVETYLSIYHEILGLQ